MPHFPRDLSANAVRQAHVAGVVRNVAGRPIVGALVTILPQDVTVVTGPDGSFALSFPAGRVALHVRAEGYTAAVVEALDLGPGITWRREVRLASASHAPFTGHRASLA
jgi:hypothetical protein